MNRKPKTPNTPTMQPPPAFTTQQQPPPPPRQPPPNSKQSATRTTTTSNNQKMKKMPTPQELITLYESQGMSTNEAAVKAIDDLQRLLFRVVTSSDRGGSSSGSIGEASRKLDAVNARLAIVERKLDSKPNFPQSFAVGVASAAAARGVAAVWPEVAGGVGRVWNAVRGITNDKP